MKHAFTILLVTLSVFAHAADFDPRATFGFTPGRDVDAALKRAAKDNKRVLLFTYDPRGDGSFPGHDIKYFMELQETKKIVKDTFITVLLTRGHADLKPYPAPVAPEKAYYVLIRPDGSVIKTGTVSVSSATGLKAVKELATMQ